MHPEARDPKLTYHGGDLVRARRRTQMRPISRGLAATLLLLSTGAVAACNSDTGEQDEGSGSKGSGTGQTGSPVGNQATPQEQAINDAKALTRAYYDFRDDAQEAPDDVNQDDWAKYLTQPELDAQKNYFQKWKDGGFTTSGDARFKWMRAANAKVDQSGRTARVKLEVCYDTSDVITRDGQQREVERITVLPATLQLENTDFPNADAWRIRNETVHQRRCG